MGYIPNYEEKWHFRWRVKRRDLANLFFSKNENYPRNTTLEDRIQEEGGIKGGGSDFPYPRKFSRPLKIFLHSKLKKP